MKKNKWSGKNELSRVSTEDLPDYILKNKNKYYEWFS